MLKGKENTSLPVFPPSLFTIRFSAPRPGDSGLEMPTVLAILGGNE
jgi:hypothetical protein